MAETTRLSSEAKAARAPAPALRPRRPSPAAALQHRLGNRRVQHALEISRASDPAEGEARRVAARVSGRCACGGVAPPGGECAACRAKRLGVQRSARGGAPAPAVAPSVVEQALQEPGRPLDSATRSSMEAHLGDGLGGVRVHEGAVASTAARAVSADAFTVGSDVVFAEGRYRPHTRSGLQLLAHELVHVVQQDGRIARQPRAGAKDEIATYGAFKTRVFAAAGARLDQNVAKLDEWRAFVDQQFSALGLRAQLGAGEALRLAERAQAQGQGIIYENWAATRSPASRALAEDVINQKIKGACGYCHASTAIWQWNATHQREFKDLPTTAQRLTLFADQAELDRVVDGAPATLRPLAPFTPGAPPGPEPIGMPALVQPPAAPAPNVYPARRSTLCGPMPPAKQERPAAFDPRLWGSSSAAALQAIGRIGPVLEPLGPSGYQVLPEGIFSTLYNRTPEQLQQDVRRGIELRQTLYRRLKQMIAAGELSYDELCPIVDELLPAAAPTVRYLVESEIESAKFRKKVLDTILAIVSAAMLLLAVVFPPAAVLAIGAGMGVAGVVMGARDYREGTTVELGIGAGVFAPEKEAAAAHLRAGGIVSMVTGALGLASAGFGVAARMHMRISAPQGMPAGKWQPMPGGAYMAVHPKNRTWVVIQEGDQLMAGVMTGDDFVVLARARSPWGAGPPPNTPTWAEWTAQRGGTVPKPTPKTTALVRRPTAPPARTAPPPRALAAPAVTAAPARAALPPAKTPPATRPASLRVVAEGPAQGRHRLQVLSDGTVTRCSAYCPTLLSQYSEELAVRTELRDELIAIQDLYPAYVARDGAEAAAAWVLSEARPIELRLARYRMELARERAAVRLLPRGASRPSWALRRENVPEPSAFEQTMVDRYQRALMEFRAGRMEASGERITRAIREMDTVEGAAANPAHPEGVHLGPHIATLRAARRRLVEGGPSSWALVSVRGVDVDVVGLAARELPRFTQGEILAPLTSRLPALAGRSYSQLERLLGPPQQYSPHRHRVTWHLGDGSMVHLDNPGPDVLINQPYQLNRRAHLQKTLLPPYNMTLAVSDLGTIVPPHSTPAHIPVTISAAELAHVERLKLPSTPPKRNP